MAAEPLLPLFRRLSTAMLLVTSASASSQGRDEGWRRKTPVLSQGHQDSRLAYLFSELNIRRGSYVEFGCPGLKGANTAALEAGGWHGVRFDGKHQDIKRRIYKHWISTETIVALFRRYGVDHEVDYVSIDIDSADIWIFEAIVQEYRPKVFTIEYNSNLPWGCAIAFPDPARPEHATPGVNFTWDRGCYYGSSAMAIDFAARKHNYVVVDVEPGLDLFLVRSDLWGGRNVPNISQVVFRPINIHRATAPMSPHRRRTLLDMVVYEQNRSVSAARDQADMQLRRLRGLAGLCYNQKASDAYYRSNRSHVMRCHHLFSDLYEETCLAYPKSNGVPLYRQQAVLPSSNPK